MTLTEYTTLYKVEITEATKSLRKRGIVEGGESFMKYLLLELYSFGVDVVELEEMRKLIEEED